MVSHKSRRKRRCRLVAKEGPHILMSDNMFGSLLLDHAGLSPSESLMVLASTGNATNVGNIKDVLTLQHGR
eukprot:4441895-Pyramimonas_sp.AAC.1